jgi:release factor glutamine methyltransferase
VGDDPPFEVVVSNPPYVRTGDLAGLAPEVRDHEPCVALDGGPDGLAVLRLLVAGAADALRPGGALFLEIGADQEVAVREALETASGWTDVSIGRDLAGRSRFASARVAEGVRPAG